jgi:hypothetical protein
VYAALLSLAVAAPVPREPLPSLAGAWDYRWGGAPGAMHLSACGSYRAWHGESRHEYAGRWWVDRGGKVIVSEYRVGEWGQQIGPPVRYEFTPRRVGTGWELTSSNGLRVVLVQP